MKWLCCFAGGPPELLSESEATQCEQRHEVRSYGDAQDRAISQACARVMEGLPLIAASDWPERIANMLASVQDGLGYAARLVVFSADGLAWAWTMDDSGGDESQRVAYTHLAEILLEQVDASVVVMRRCAAAGRDVHSMLSWPARQPIVLEPSDMLCLPIHQAGTKVAAALLLGGLQQQSFAVVPAAAVAQSRGKAATASAFANGSNIATAVVGGLASSSKTNTTLSPEDVSELRRLAQFVGYGLLGEPVQARYLSQVCGHLSLLPSAPSLHDLVLGLLEGVHDTCTTKFAVQLHPVLAAVHGPSTAAALFSLRSSTGGVRPSASEANLQAASLMAAAYNSASGLLNSRPSGHQQHPLTVERSNVSTTSIRAGLWTGTVGDGCSGPGGSGGGGGGGGPEPSRIKGTKTALAHTLLLQATRPSPANLPSGASRRLRQHGSVGAELGSHHAAPPLHHHHTNMDSPTTSVGTQPRPASSGVGRQPHPLQALFVPNASSHVLEDNSPCRDVLLVTNLTGGKSGSLVLVTESAAASSPAGTRDGTAGGLQQPTQPLPGHSAESSGDGADDGGGVAGMKSEAGGAAAAAAARTSPSAAAAATSPPFQLALYLLSAERLPAGMLRLVATELQSLLPLFFGAFRTALSGADSNHSRTSHDWRRLQEQLLGITPTSLTIPTCVEDHSLRSIPVTLTLQSPQQQQPQGLQRSGPSSSRLFRPALASPNAGLGSGVASPPPTHNPPSLQPAGSLLRAGSLGKPGPFCAGPPSAPGFPYQSNLPSPLLAGLHAKAVMSSGLAVSHGGGVVRKGVLAMMAAKEEARTVSSPGAADRATDGGGTDGSGHDGVGSGGTGGGGGEGSPRSFKTLRLIEYPYADSDAMSGTGLLASPHRKGSGLWRLQSLPEVTLERAARQPAVDMLVSSMRQGLTVAGTDGEEQAAQTQDLAAIQLLEVLGRGGQGVVFRGALHGLETAVKVLTDGDDANKDMDKDKDKQGEQAGGGAGGGGGGAGGGAAELKDAVVGDSSDDAWYVEDKAGEARIRQAKRGAMEIAVMGTMSHPSIVQVYATFSGVVVVRCQFHDSPEPEMRLCFPTDEMLGGNDPGPLNQVICLEYCDGGTLLDAARAGAFRQLPACATNGAAFPSLVPLYTSLLEVALALRYLHSRKLVHCDLKAANVLLKSSTRDPRGWTCKLSDFGCARMLTEPGPDGRADNPQGFRTVAPVGTIGFLAPECFIKDSLLSAAVDVYAFGIMMWEILMSRTPYSSMNAKDVPRQVIRNNLRPSFHPLAPGDYCALAVRCWAGKAERRPTAINLVGLLEQLLAEAQASAYKQVKMGMLPASAASGPHTRAASASEAAYQGVASNAAFLHPPHLQQLHPHQQMLPLPQMPQMPPLPQVPQRQPLPPLQQQLQQQQQQKMLQQSPQSPSRQGSLLAHQQQLQQQQQQLLPLQAAMMPTQVSPMAPRMRQQTLGTSALDGGGPLP